MSDKEFVEGVLGKDPFKDFRTYAATLRIEAQKQKQLNKDEAKTLDYNLEQEALCAPAWAFYTCLPTFAAS